MFKPSLRFISIRAAILFVPILLLSACVTPSSTQEVESLTFDSVVFSKPEQCEIFDSVCYDLCVDQTVQEQREHEQSCYVGCMRLHPSDEIARLACIQDSCGRFDLAQAQRACRNECTSTQPPACGECVESFETGTAICTREVPKDVTVTTRIRVGCERTAQWTAAGWQCGPCITPHPIAVELQFRTCECGEAKWTEACMDQPLFEGEK